MPSASPSQRFVDSRPVAIAQRQQIAAIRSSPAVIAQLAAIDAIHHSPIVTTQRQRLPVVQRKPVPKLVDGSIKWYDDQDPLQTLYDSQWEASTRSPFAILDSPDLGGLDVPVPIFDIRGSRVPKRRQPSIEEQISQAITDFLADFADDPKPEQNMVRAILSARGYDLVATETILDALVECGLYLASANKPSVLSAVIGATKLADMARIDLRSSIRILNFFKCDLEQTRTYLEKRDDRIKGLISAHAAFTKVNPQFIFLRGLGQRVAKTEQISLENPGHFLALCGRFSAKALKRAQAMVLSCDEAGTRIDFVEKEFLKAHAPNEDFVFLTEIRLELREALNAMGTRTIAPFKQAVLAMDKQIVILLVRFKTRVLDSYELRFFTPCFQWIEKGAKQQQKKRKLELDGIRRDTSIAVEEYLGEGQGVKNLDGRLIALRSACGELMEALPGFKIFGPEIPQDAVKKRISRPDLIFPPLEHTGWTLTFVVAGDLLDIIDSMGAQDGFVNALHWSTQSGAGEWNVIKPRMGGDGYELKIKGIGTYRWKVPKPKGAPGQEGAQTLRFTKNSIFNEK